MLYILVQRIYSTSCFQHAQNIYCFCEKKRKWKATLSITCWMWYTHIAAGPLLALPELCYAEHETISAALVPNACQLFNYILHAFGGYPIYSTHILTYSVFHSCSSYIHFHDFSLLICGSPALPAMRIFPQLSRKLLIKHWIQTKKKNKFYTPFQLRAEIKGNHKIELYDLTGPGFFLFCWFRSSLLPDFFLFWCVVYVFVCVCVGTITLSSRRCRRHQQYVHLK